MFSPQLLKSINLTLAFAMLMQPILAAVPTPVAHAAPADPAPLAAASPAYPAAAPAEPLVARVPVDKDLAVTQGRVEEALRTAPIMFIENDSRPGVSTQGKERPQKTFRVQGAGGLM